ncbi:MAG: response regulator [Spirochaetales bacterium]|nr:response regulator [Spirochaetales bacterium]
MNDENKKILLLVEDEVLIAMAKQQELENYGYNVITVNSGEKAVLLSKENKHIDLILMDIDLGRGIDGTEAAELILKERQIPVVFVSSHTEPEVVEKTEKITSYGYVVKNSNITVLDASIKMAFKLYKAHTELNDSNEKFSKAFDNHPTAMTIFNTKTGKRIDINKSYTDLLKIDKQIFLNGNAFTDNMWWVDPDEPGKGIKLLKEKKEISNYPMNLIDRKGVIKNLIANASLLDNDTNSNLAIVSFVDVTEIKKFQEHLITAEAKYEKLFKLGFEGLIFHKDGVALEVNNVFLEITGYKKEEIIGQNLISYVILPQYHSLVAEKIKEKYTKPYEIEAIKKNGEIIRVELESRDIEGEDTRITAFRELKN